MKKITIVSLSLLLSACVSNTYETEVTSESYREEFQPAPIEKPIQTAVAEETVMTQQTSVAKVVPQEERTVVKLAPANDAQQQVKIIPPSQKQMSQAARYGYTVQVAAVGTQAKVSSFARQLPNNGQPVWEHYKVVNGTKWYSVLYGDFGTRKEAEKAIAQLPESFRDLKPFIKSIDSIKNSEFPDIVKIK
ncbi:SPOR domain-containing protein [Vibrio maerlii]|uniref:SPOR domain-containing protein n=1 Tax=Vibrio maerlii TaxID=2231648 RepID=UPI000E3CC225|nr:SPOR domain-containing protein [Vibrio maerlii]